jgi:hypothetical protein
VSLAPRFLLHDGQIANSYAVFNVGFDHDVADSDACGA